MNKNFIIPSVWTLTSILWFFIDFVYAVVVSLATLNIWIFAYSLSNLEKKFQKSKDGEERE